MSKPIDRIRAKITRAKQHINDFQLAARAFTETNPYAISMKEDQKAGQRIFYIEKADCVPDSLTAIAADVIQNLRSPLDHIAYQLVLHFRGGTEPDWTVYYPISGSAAHYPSTRGGKIKSVPQDVIDAIDATQPYRGGKGHALWQLNELNKPDKHESLLSVGAFYHGVDFMPIIQDSIENGAPDFVRDGLNSLESVVFPVANKLMPLNVGDQLWAEPLDMKMKNQRRFTFDIAIHAPGVIVCKPALKTFQDMANLVDDIITTLGKLLP
jgi:hypothetical protein